VVSRVPGNGTEVHTPCAWFTFLFETWRRKEREVIASIMVTPSVACTCALRTTQELKKKKKRELTARKERSTARISSVFFCFLMWNSFIIIIIILAYL
jgi:hypothetical protein